MFESHSSYEIITSDFFLEKLSHGLNAFINSSMPYTYAAINTKNYIISIGENGYLSIFCKTHRIGKYTSNHIQINLHHRYGEIGDWLYKDYMYFISGIKNFLNDNQDGKKDFHAISFNEEEPELYQENPFATEGPSILHKVFSVEWVEKNG